MGVLTLEKFSDGCQLPGASPADIAACEAELKILLPAEIKAFRSCRLSANSIDCRIILSFPQAFV